MTVRVVRLPSSSQLDLYLTQSSASTVYAPKSSPDFINDISIKGTTPELNFLNPSGSAVSTVIHYGVEIPGEAEMIVTANPTDAYTKSSLYLYAGAAELITNIGSMSSLAAGVGAGVGFSIHHGTNGTLLKVDTSGRVTTPKNPAFNVTYTDGSVTFGTGVIVFNTVRTNVGSYYSTSTGRFTAPVSGHYQFNVHFFKYTSYNNPSNTYWGFRKNGSTIITTNHGAAGSDGGQSLNTTIYLAANDYIDVYAQNTIQSWGDQFLQFSGHLVG